MAAHVDRFHPLPDRPSTAPGITRQVPAYRDRETATWSLLDPAEQICLSCALPARLEAHTACVAGRVAHDFASRGLATARHALDMG
jgi:hypothetical protein